jgi:hypothetical protein
MTNETLEEAAEKYANDWEEIYPELDSEDITPIAVSKIDFIAGAKWQAERMYTLEQISKDFIGEEGQSGYFDDWLDYRLDSKNKLSFREWFKQFKKK